MNSNYYITSKAIIMTARLRMLPESMMPILP